jgi:adenylate cyclase
VRRFLASNRNAAFAIGALAFLIAAASREAGVLERTDLAMNDGLARSGYPAAPDDRIVVVLESEADLHRWKYPLSDDVFADLLTRIFAGDPAAVAIDKYRDVPVAPGSERLAEMLRKSDRLYWVRKLGSSPSDAVSAPAALDPRFAGCADTVGDRDGIMRRALLYLDDGKDVCYSLGFQVARHIAAQSKTTFAVARDDPDRFDLGSVPVRAVEGSDGPYAHVDAAGFQVPFPSARAARMRAVGLTDVLEGRVDPATFRGKAVFFGSDAESLRDYFFVPAPGREGSAKVSGVTVHAALASYLLEASQGRSPPMKLAPHAFSLALTAFFSLAAAWVACLRRSMFVTTWLAIVLFAALGFTAHAMAHNGVFGAFAAPFLALFLALSAGIARGLWLERQERAQLMSLFGRHVSHEVASDLWQRREEFFAHGGVRPQQVIATIFFLDVRSFTTVSEKLDPARLVVWLNRGLTTMIGAITANHGVVTRFAGDAIMAIFGVPVPRSTEEQRAMDAVHAIEAALAIGPALDRLNAEFAGEGLPAIRVRIGINTGSVTQCSVGAADRAEFTVLGDATNTASRLESYTMEDRGETARILIGEDTFRYAAGRFATEMVGDLSLKGKEKPVTVRQVLSKLPSEAA